MEQKTYSTQLAGRQLTFEFGRYAQQAGGSVLVRIDDTVILVCASIARESIGNTRASISIAVTLPARAARATVNAPAPAPISTTASDRLAPTRVAIFSTMFLSVRKFCPRDFEKENLYSVQSFSSSVRLLVVAINAQKTGRGNA
jgi:hypothetical protein